MSDTAQPLHMLQLRVSARALPSVARHHRLPPRFEDQGYLLHCLLRCLLGEAAPQPFALRPADGPWVSLLGYTPEPIEALQDRALGAVAAGGFRDWFEAVDWAGAATKEMPARWEAGQRLAFELRACPVVRALRDSEHARKGSEVDAFLAACAAHRAHPPQDPAATQGTTDGNPKEPSRDEVYGRWLRGCFERQGGAALSSARMERFQWARFVRQDHGQRAQGERRTAHTSQRPDVTFLGQLTVQEPAAFLELVRLGLGRHRAFGFGMVLLRPPSAD
jgi:CRISPR system Cascade subunit CasE